MLQPLQLQEVAARYAPNIAELRDFFLKTGLPLEAQETLHSVAVRLQQDRSFHRDLTSHLWVLMHRQRNQTNYSDLLGIVALAAAGPRHATAAEETDALQLLRFVMETSDALHSAADTPPPPAPIAAPVAAATAVSSANPEPPAPRTVPPPFPRPAPEPLSDLPFQRTSEPAPEARQLPLRPRPVAVPAEPPRRFDPPELHRTNGNHKETPDRPRGWLALVLFAFIILIGALSFGIWRNLRPAPENGSTTAPAPATDSTAQPANAPSTEGTRPATPESGAGSPTSAPTAEVPEKAATSATRDASSANTRDTAKSAKHSATAIAPIFPATQTPTHPAQQTSRTNAMAPSAVPRSMPNSNAAIASMALPGKASTGTAAGLASTSHIAPGTNAKAKIPAAIPANTLSKNIGARTIPADAYASVDSKHPRLYRRTPPDSSLRDEGIAQVAELNPAIGAFPSRNAGANPLGTVHSGLEGTMAGNILYSPTPAYPSAAAAAHVQGQVRIRAAIDREGNVASARVVSGPPQLADAALNAVQQWRFKPWTTGGHAVSSSATAILDFDLP